VHLSLRVTEVPKKVLKGKIALVAGVTRGAGRWIAIALGEAGATVLPAAVHGDGPLHPADLKLSKKPLSWSPPPGAGCRVKFANLLGLALEVTLAARPSRQ